MAQAEDYRWRNVIEILLKTEEKVRSEINDRSKRKDWSKTTSKQGHHIINKGVIDIYEDIILQFVRDYGRDIFEGKSYKDLKTEMTSDEGENEALDFLFVNSPLSPESTKFIRKTKVHENGWNYRSNNDLIFGLAKLNLTVRASYLMIKKYEVLDGEENGLLPLLEEFRNKIDEHFFPLQNYAYVDQPAVDKWREENPYRQDSKFDESINEVRIMIEKVTYPQTEDEIPLVFHWGKGAFLISKAL